jgi:hypothetical protein
MAMLNNFSAIDDMDILVLIKNWATNKDKVLSELSNNLINRHLFKIEIQDTPFEPKKISELSEKASKLLKLNKSEIEYYVFTDHISKNAYSAFDDKIRILYKDGSLKDVGDASDILNTAMLSRTVKKYFLCYPKEII